jgi:hypothetical protein
MTETPLRVAPRSAGAIADVELLRVARTSATDLGPRRPQGLGGRVRGLLGRGVSAGA